MNKFVEKIMDDPDKFAAKCTIILGSITIAIYAVADYLYG